MNFSHPWSFLLRTRFACLAALAVLLLAACGADDQDREFAPEINEEQTVEPPAPRLTSTPEPLNRQPGESETESGNTAELIRQVGSAIAVGYGLDEVTVLTVEDGEGSSTHVPRDGSSISAVAPDGSLVLTIDRRQTSVIVVGRDPSGKELGRWQAPAAATPGATPVTRQPSQSGDLIVWDRLSAHAVVAIGEVGVFVANRDLNLSPIASVSPTSLTAAAWGPAGQSIAFAFWDADRQAARILTASLQDLSRLTLVLEVADGDGRFVRSMAWGNEQVGLVFALRSLNAGFSFPSDLYHLPRFGQPMRLLATAGAAAPAAVIDQIATAANGSTVAYTVLIPGGSGYRFHSLWLIDATTPGPFRIDTPGLRRVSELVWTTRGLTLVGTRRETTDDALFQSSVVELVTAEGLIEIGVVRSEATPVGSPRASP